MFFNAIYNSLPLHIAVGSQRGLVKRDLRQRGLPFGPEPKGPEKWPKEPGLKEPEPKGPGPIVSNLLTRVGKSGASVRLG